MANYGLAGWSSPSWVTPHNFAHNGPPLDRAAPSLPSGGQELGFADLVDVVNPLQHIPVIGGLYRSLSGDSIAPASRIIGGGVFGGPLGMGLALLGMAVEEILGNPVTALTGLLRGQDTAAAAGKYQLAEQLDRAGRGR